MVMEVLGLLWFGEDPKENRGGGMVAGGTHTFLGQASRSILYPEVR